ncbi:MAG: TnpV protein [Pseudoflavonifractor sp.]|nr:TnpV protein [Pseudoflavonifractor sp.]
MELTYTKCGDYYIPDLAAPESPKIGKYGRMRHRFLRDNHSGYYSGFLLSGMNVDLEETDLAAKKRMELLTAQMAKAEGVTEALKASDQMEWVGRMNNVRSRAEEIVLHELVYSL